MSTGTSVPRPRVPGMDVSDSALLATLLREAPIGFAFFGSDSRFRRVNQTLARWRGIDQAEHIGYLPSEVWPEQLAQRAESAVRRVIASNSSLVGILNSAMNSFPFRTNRREFSSHGRPDLDNFRRPKSDLVEQGHRATRTIQLKPCPRAAALDGMNVWRRMIVGVDRHTHVSDR